MSLRPIDMTITIQNASEANRVQQSNDNTRPEIAQQQFADRLNKEVQLSDQQVAQTPKSEHARVDRDGRGNTGGKDSGQKKKPADKKTGKPPAARSSGGSMFDISV